VRRLQLTVLRVLYSVKPNRTLYWFWMSLNLKSRMRISNLLFAGLILVAGCSHQNLGVQTQAYQPKVQFDPSQPHYIYVSGYVRNAGKYVWTNGMTLGSAINSAGGFTEFASRRRLRINHADGLAVEYRVGPGRSQSTNDLVYPDDRIFIPEGPVTF
jgi:protein involved in polysaccharide export with SLBB domain